MKREGRRLINPAELMIFLVVVGLMGKSVFNLFNEAPNIQSPAGSRAIASVKSDPLKFGEVELPCFSGSEFQVKSSRVRFVGSLCPYVGTHGESQRNPSALETPRTVTLKNMTNGTQGTLFTQAHTYSSDYLLMEKGRNMVHLSFVYGKGRVQNFEYYLDY